MATILVIDYAARNREDLAESMRRQGHRLLETVDGAEALAMVHAERPDLIIGNILVPMSAADAAARHGRPDRKLSVNRVPWPSEERLEPVQPRAKSTPPGPVDDLPAGDITPPQQEAKSGAGDEPRRALAVHRRPDSVERQHTAAPLDARAAFDRALFDDMPDAVLLSNDRSHIVEANPAACELLGYSRDELLKMDLLGITPEQEHPTVTRVWRQFIATGKLQGEHVVLRKDGTRREIECSGVANTLEGLHLSVLRDVSEQKRTERELRDSHERFRQLTEHLGEVFWMGELGGTRWLYVSPAYERIWGRSCESLYKSPHSWQEAIHPADRERVVGGRALGSAAETDDVTYRIVQPDGAIRYVRDHVFPVCNPSGEVICVAAVSRDVTDLKEAEEELQHISRRREALSEIDCAILMARASQELANVVLSRVGSLIPCTRACVLTFDFETGQMTVLAASNSVLAVGSQHPIDSLGDIKDLHGGQYRLIDDLPAKPRPCPLALQLLADAARSYLVVPIKSRRELMGVLILGSEKNAMLTREHADVAGEVMSRFAMALQQVRLFEQVRDGQDRLKRLSLQLMQAHEDERRHISRELHDEVGQALTAAKVNLQEVERLAKGTSSSLPIRDTMAILDNTLRQVRDLSLDLRPSMLDDLGLAPAVRGYLDRQSQRAGFTTEFHPDDSVAAARIAPEVETACFRVVQEALTNVVRHANARHVRVELWQDDNNLEVLIRDDGVGFDVEAAQQRTARGDSLGLLGLRERVELLGGRIEIQSAPKQGTRIHACFPSNSDFIDAPTDS